MAKGAVTVYVCQSCGNQERKWLGKCPSCGSWNTLVEEVSTGATSTQARGRPTTAPRPAGRAIRITDVDVEKTPRMKLDVGDLDRVLGGGFVPGSLVLIGGEPGVGKSTLLLTCARQLAQTGVRTLYVSAEESTSQTRLRAERLKALHPELYLLAETDLSVVISEIARLQPKALVLDSVQTVYVPELDAAPGSVSQVREVTARMMHLAKGEGISVFLVGHVTKDGAIAGPRMLEHMVDTVLSFENTRSSSHRVLRAHKNRFGSTQEIAVFEMHGDGLAPVDNPSAFFLAERPKGRPGSLVTATIEGTRPLLIEVQGLCVASNSGNPRRTTLGVDSTRVSLLAAVLERRAGLQLSGQDLFVNIAGGVSVEETAIDLPICLAIASSIRNRPVDAGLVCMGEIGLAGEVRGVERVELRILEATRLGFTKIMLPAANMSKIDPPKGVTLLPVVSLDDAIYQTLDNR